MQRLTIIRTPGDPDELLAAKREHIDPVLERAGGQPGHIFHVAARGPDGLVVVGKARKHPSGRFRIPTSSRPGMRYARAG